MYNELNKVIDHTFLKPDATKDELEHFCTEAAKYRFVCVALLPNFVDDGVKLLQGTGVHVMAAASYPRGQVPLKIKQYEIEDALERGADEIDMVLNLHAIKTGNIEIIRQEIKMLRELTLNKIGKVILETTLLCDEEIVTVCSIASGIGIDFVKTSTGFDGNKASLHAVELMKQSVTGHTRVKAAGGISTLELTIAMMRAGAERIGTSAGPVIIETLKKDGRSLSELMESEEYNEKWNNNQKHPETY